MFSNLDAVDGLAFPVVQAIREDIVKRLSSIAKQALSKRKCWWVVSCYHQYVGWFPDTGMAGSATPEDGTGQLKSVLRHDTFCPTPGMTVPSVSFCGSITSWSGKFLGAPLTNIQMCLNGIGQIPMSVCARTPSRLVPA